jgi:hypothetical protein
MRRASQIDASSVHRLGRVDVACPVPLQLRRLRPVASTAVASFVLKGGFILRAWR